MVKKKEHVPNERSWHEAVNKVVAVLEANDVKDVGDVRSSMERKLEYPLKLGKTSLSKVFGVVSASFFSAGMYVRARSIHVSVL